jgi:uncharacterized protein YutE (UPF0331/DUF86 family)
MKLNIEKILRKCRQIDEAIGQLERVKSISKEEFIANTDYKYIAYAAFIILTEAVIDICFHISAKKLKIAPTEYAECFEILKKNNLLDASIAEVLKDMARFRNLLVHGYEKIDFEKIYNYIFDDLQKIEIFKQIVKSFIETKGDGN